MLYDFDDAVSWLRDLLQINSVETSPLPGCPFGEGVGKCLDYSLNLCNNLGFSIKNVEGFCGWAEIGEGELFGILSHLDVVPEGDNWKHPPYGAEIENGKLFGRGALDDKGPFVACLFAAVKLLQEGLHPKKRIRFILGCDEESGWKCMDRYFMSEEIPALGISPDADFPVINCEKGIVYHTLTLPLPEGVYEISGGLRPNMVPDSAFCRVKATKNIINRADELDVSCKIENGFARLSASGVSAHGSHPEKGINALYKIFDCLAEDYPEFSEMYQAFNDNCGKTIKLALSDEKSGNLSLNLGTCRIEGKNIVLELDIRHPISYNKDDITDILKRNLSCKVEQGFYHKPLFLDENHPLVTTLLKAYDTVLGNAVPSKPVTIGGGTYARALPIGVAFGPILPDTEATIHEKNEFIELSHFRLLIDIYYRAIKEICFV